MQPVKAGCRRPGTPLSSPTPQPPSPPSPLSPKANTSASAAWWGKSLPAELDRSPAALPSPRQHPSLTRSLPLLALPLTLTPSAGAEALPEWAAGRAGAGVGGHSRSGSPKGQCYGWEAGLRGIQGSKISGHLQSPTHPLPKVWQWGAGSLSFHEVGGEGGRVLSPGGQKFGVLHALTAEQGRPRAAGQPGEPKTRPDGDSLYPSRVRASYARVAGGCTPGCGGQRGSWILNPEAWSLSEVPWLEQLGSFLTPEVTRESSLGRAPLSASFEDGSWGAGVARVDPRRARLPSPGSRKWSPAQQTCYWKSEGWAAPPVPTSSSPAPPPAARAFMGTQAWTVSLKSFLPLPSLNPARPEGDPGGES